MNNIWMLSLCLLAIVLSVVSIRHHNGGPPKNGTRIPTTHNQTRRHSATASRTINRQRREADVEPKPKHKGAHPNTRCCNVEAPAGVVDEYAKKVLAIHKECVKQIETGGTDGNGGNEKNTPRIQLLACAYKKYNAIDDAGNILVDGAKKFFAETPMADHEKNVMDAAIDRCAQKKDENGSKGVLMKFQNCMTKEFANACPADKQDQSERCVAIREGKPKPKKKESNKEQ